MRRIKANFPPGQIGVADYSLESGDRQQGQLGGPSKRVQCWGNYGQFCPFAPMT